MLTLELVEYLERLGLISDIHEDQEKKSVIVLQTVDWWVLTAL